MCIRDSIPALKKTEDRVTLDNRVRSFITPQRIVYQDGDIQNGQVLLQNRTAQQSLGIETYCEFPGKASILLDYGFEFQGGIGISISGTSEPIQKTVRLRIRFGESVQEAMSDVDTSVSYTHLQRFGLDGGLDNLFLLSYKFPFLT